MKNCVKCYKPTGTVYVEWKKGATGNLSGSFVPGRKLEDEGVVCESCWKEFLTGHPTTPTIDSDYLRIHRDLLRETDKLHD